MIQVEHEPRQIAVSAALMILTVLVQTAGMFTMSDLTDRGTAWVARRATSLRHMAVMSALMLFLFAMHLVQMSVWATVYWLVLPQASFPVALYESAISFTTLDVAELPLGWRFLPAADSRTGMLMFALSTGAMYSVFSTLAAARREYRRQHRGRRATSPPAA